MKRDLVRSFLCIILALAMLLTAAAAFAESGESHGGFGGGGVGGGSAGGDDSGGGSMEPPPTQEPADDRYEVVKEYRWQDESGYNYGMVIRNKSGAACGYIIDMTFLDSAGFRAGGAMKYVNTCDDGYETFVQAACESPFERVQHKITVTDPDYNDTASFVKVTAEKVGNAAVVKGVNTGTVNAQFVQFYVLFLNDSGQVVKADWGYLVDSDSELKSGKTQSKTVLCSEPFSSVDVYASGRTEKNVVNTGTVEIAEESGAGYEVTRENTWDSPWGFHYYALAVKNVSGKDAGIKATVTFYDAGGNALNVQNLSTDVCGDGYEICMLTFLEEPFDHAEYTVDLAEPFDKRKDIHADIQVEVNADDPNNATLKATNTGEATAMDVEYIVLYLDAEGKAVNESWGFFPAVEEGGRNGVIGPGETRSTDLYSSVPYESVAVYIKGYHK